MKNKELHNSLHNVTAEFSAQETATLTNDLLQQVGLDSQQTSIETLELNPEPNLSQIKTQSKAKKGAVLGGFFGAFFGLLACIIRTQVTGQPIWPTNPGLATLSISLAASIIGSICFSLIGIISVSEVSSAPLPTNSKIPSHKYLVTVNGSEEEIKKAVDIIKENKGIIAT